MAESSYLTVAEISSESKPVALSVGCPVDHHIEVLVAGVGEPMGPSADIDPNTSDSIHSAPSQRNGVAIYSKAPFLPVLQTDVTSDVASVDAWYKYFYIISTNNIK